MTGRARVLGMLFAVVLAAAIGSAGAALVQCAGPAPVRQSDETTLEGVLEVLIEDSNSTSRTLYFLIAGSQRVPLRFAETPPALTTGLRVRVRGRLEADGTLAVTTLERVS